jgi:hypothetical protein
LRSFLSGTAPIADFSRLERPGDRAHVCDDYARLIGSIRRECLDHIIVSGEAHLHRILISYAAYYNSVRTHRSLHKDAPIFRPIQQIGIIGSHPTLADFTIKTPEFKVFGTHRGIERFRSLNRRGPIPQGR